MTLKTVKVNPTVHSLLMERARTEGASAGTALMRMLTDTSVKVPLEPVQRERWEAAAAAAGVSLPQFILLRVEAQLSAVPPGVPAVFSETGHPLPVTDPTRPDVITWPCCPPPPAQ